jgi:RNA-binding protein FUS
MAMMQTQRSKQCNENCGDICDKTRVYISGLLLDVKEEELRVHFGGIGQVARLKLKQGYKDQWPWNIKIHTDKTGKSKGRCCAELWRPVNCTSCAGGFFKDY